MSDSDEPIDNISEGGDDLFGDDPDDGGLDTTKDRVLDDDDLATDPEDNEDARSRREDSERPQDEERERLILEVPTYRHPIPKPSDGILRALRVPKFMKFLPQEYQPEAFEPTAHDIANARSDQPQYVARFSRDATTNLLKSNTNILRWSDGSVTISVGGDQYEISKKPLAPPPDKPYNEVKDVHYYAAAAEISSNLLMTVGHITEQYNIRPNKAVGDEALNILAEKMAQASKAREHDIIIKTTQDPELQKRQAEVMEKDMIKAQRRRENAQLRQDGELGRGRGGLSIGGLEGRGAGAGRKRGAPGAPKPKRRRPEYDSDDDLPSGAHNSEKYDMDDGFLVDSDEEEEIESDADDDEEEILDERRSKKRQKTSEPEDASGDEVEPSHETSRGRRRNVINDDDSE